jgi:hypothetical protein
MPLNKQYVYTNVAQATKIYCTKMFTILERYNEICSWSSHDTLESQKIHVTHLNCYYEKLYITVCISIEGHFCSRHTCWAPELEYITQTNNTIANINCHKFKYIHIMYRAFALVPSTYFNHKLLQSSMNRTSQNKMRPYNS